ncbi:MAG: Uncharacterized protein AWL62_948 [Halanaerobium sp. T82-1]|jgi:hypothetical protein|nr:MAG: Uncharacterized protein AWL62_948 [Halanaerobium sp. T82-1]PUU92001.1 MAG: Uncharacterized protein CI949_1776 [Halanaerobium sp.]
MEAVKLKLLISIKSVEEALIVKDSKFDILDIKNPAEGSLGANFPGVIKEIIEKSPNRVISAAGGDLPGLPGLSSQITFGLANLKPNFIKLGFYNFNDFETAVKIINEAKNAIRLSGTSAKLIAAAYGDYKEINSFNPFLLNELAFKTEIDGIMIDTINKDGRSLFDFLKPAELKDFCQQAKKAEVFSALAGSLSFDDLGLLKEIKPDIVGFRGAVCENNDRSSKINSGLINQLYQKLQN